MLSKDFPALQAAESCKSGDLSFTSSFENSLFSKLPEPNQEWLINRQDFGQSRHLKERMAWSAMLPQAALQGAIIL